MRKATQKTTQPVRLGTKRSCPKCSAKFYDFNKAEVPCPKCNTTFNVAELINSFFAAPTPKKPKSAERAQLEPLSQGDSQEVEFESVDDLGDDDADGVEDIEVDDDKDDDTDEF